MFDPKKFTIPEAKPLPIYLLLDVSGSMEGIKLLELNKAISKMIADFKDQSSEIPIYISILLFGSKSSIEMLPTEIHHFHWEPLELDQCRHTGRNIKGITPMGVTFMDLKELVEDKNITPSRAYRPLILLVSDGKPNKGWQEPLNNLISKGRSSKCDRMSMAIGKDANHEVLFSFVKGTGNKVFIAEDTSQISNFFKLVTMSITKRIQSKNPNTILAPLESKNIEDGY